MLFLKKKPVRIAVIIVNYNMPERADSLAKYLKNNTDIEYDLYLVDNGSDLVKPAKSTTVFIKKNVQTCKGWLTGLEAADKSKVDYFAYWFLITSARFCYKSKDPLIFLTEKLTKDKNAVGIHPSLTSNSTTAWEHSINRGTNRVRRTWMIDNIASLYKSDWFNSIGRFDNNLTYGWGTDLETGLIARRQGKSLWIDDRIQIEKITDIGYKMKRMNMSANDRQKLARKNMDSVMTKKYGKDYFFTMLNEDVKEDWR